MNFKKLILIMSILIFSACSGLKNAGDIIRNEKVKTTDEFLIKKRDALTQPPEFDKIPKPDSIKKSDNVNNEGIKKILNIDESNNNKKKKFSTTEKSILNQIRK
jgi:hypothetical protein